VTTKLHLVITADGHVVEGFLTGGHVHDVSVAEQLFSEIIGCHVICDRGYDSDAFRAFLYSQNNVPVIPGRRNRKKPIWYDKALYRRRGLIERVFGKIKENKRLSMRFDKSDALFLAFIAAACIKIII
jgi:transposase